MHKLAQILYILEPHDYQINCVYVWDTQGLPLWPASPQIEYCPHGWQIPETKPWAPIPGTYHTDETLI